MSLLDSYIASYVDKMTCSYIPKLSPIQGRRKVFGIGQAKYYGADL